REALDALRAARRQGKTRGLVVLATGLGKTYLSAFDFQAMGGERVLFVAHREEILDQAKDTWQRVFPDKVVGTYQGGKRESDVDIVFASVQTLAREKHLARFPPNHFDYVVIDEFHHAAAKTYRKILGHFTPRFLLGLTATPDRTDGKSLLELCGDNLIYRRNLVHGISQRLLVPFHYFALKDSVNYESIQWRSGKFEPGELTEAVSTEEHADQALREYQRRASSGVRRTLCFCCTVEHADYMARFFERHGRRAAAVHSGPTSAPRAESLRKLKSGALEILCAVDVFNEGLDVPDINTVLMLRPTESPVVFLQQLGRGLRRADGKDALVVVDFIGNHRSFLSKPQSLLFLLGQDLPP
ncbi:MAG: DEAD/DEAH box helicase, partial [Polyangiaceae bacterium]